MLLGRWRVEGNRYYYRETKWWGDYTDAFPTVEDITSVTDSKILTESGEDGIDPNVDVRVEKFEMEEWKLKPAQR